MESSFPRERRPHYRVLAFPSNPLESRPSSEHPTWRRQAECEKRRVTFGCCPTDPLKSPVRLRCRRPGRHGLRSKKRSGQPAHLGSRRGSDSRERAGAVPRALGQRRERRNGYKQRAAATIDVGIRLDVGKRRERERCGLGDSDIRTGIAATGRVLRRTQEGLGHAADDGHGFEILDRQSKRDVGGERAK